MATDGKPIAKRKAQFAEDLKTMRKILKIKASSTSAPHSVSSIIDGEF